MIWSATSGELRKRLPGHSAGINGLAVSPDGEGVVSVSSDRTVKVWDWATESLPRTIDGFRDEVRGIEFSPDGSLLAIGAREGVVRLWNADTFDELETIRGYRGSASLGFLSDGRLTLHRPDDMQTICTLAGRTKQYESISTGLGSLVLTRDGDELQIVAYASQFAKTPTAVQRYRLN